MAVSDLVAAMADYNPRVISKAAQSRLRESLERFELASSLTYNKRTGKLVSGHQRVKLLSDANVDRVTVVDVNEATKESR